MELRSTPSRAAWAEIMTHMTGSRLIKQSRGIIRPKDISGGASRDSSVDRQRRTRIKQITALAREEPQDHLLILGNPVGNHDADQISKEEGGRRSVGPHRLTRPRADQPLSKHRSPDVEPHASTLPLRLTLAPATRVATSCASIC